MSSRDQQPSIHFAGKDIPAHEAWGKTQMLYAVNEFIARLNERLPDVATEETLAVVPEVRRRLKAIEVATPKRLRVTHEIEREARELLKRKTVEEALESFNAKYEQELSLAEFVEVSGPRAYYVALREEAREWEVNKILPSQSAEIWNEQERLAPGDPPHWTADKIERLLGGGYT